MSQIMEFTASTFTDGLPENGLPILLQLYTDWCIPCHQMHETLKAMSAELEGKVQLARLNVGKDLVFAACLDVRAVPTLLLIKEGQALKRRTGNLSKAQILEFVTQG